MVLAGAVWRGAPAARSYFVRADRPVHVISPEEVDAWLADSAVKVITIHRTDVASAQSIITDGVDLTRCSDDAAWGQGFYSRSSADPQYGEATVRVAVRLQSPLEIMDSVRDAGILELLTAQAGTDDFRAAIQAAGYDGVLVHYGQQLVVVAFESSQVKVVVSEDADG
jgi:hypothetical protein